MHACCFMLRPCLTLPTVCCRAIRTGRKEQATARWRSSQAEHDQLKANIRTVIDLVFKKREEVSLVAMYRKEACEELLCMRKQDLPETSTGRDECFPAGTIQVRMPAAALVQVLVHVVGCVD